MRIKTFFVAGLFLMIPVFLSAQRTAADLEVLLDTSAVTCQQAAWFVLSSTDNTPANMRQAYDQAVENGWLKNTEPDAPITLDKLSFLIMQAYEMKGGIMYMIIPGPRYAYRSMVSRSYIQGRSDPGMTVNGDRFLLILGNVIEDNAGEGQ